MQSLFVPKHGLGDLVEWLEPCLNETNWLFVRLDSGDADDWRLRKFLTPQLQADPKVFWWGEEGLWLPGKELLDPFPVSSFFFVSFCAAYIFPATVKHSTKPKFSETTDQGEFTESKLREACRGIEELKAKAYVADGCGLQCVFSDADLYRLAREAQR